MGFLDGIADIAIRGVVGYASSISEAKEAAETLAIAESQDGWISAEAFLAAYDVRIPKLTVRGLIEQSNVAFIGTTDDPIDSLEWHKKIKEVCPQTVRVENNRQAHIQKCFIVFL